MYYFIFQDKTFGLKNKKGTKNQKFIAQVQKQVQQGGVQRNKDEERKQAEKKAKEDAKKREEEEKKMMGKQVVVQKVGSGRNSGGISSMG